MRLDTWFVAAALAMTPVVAMGPALAGQAPAAGAPSVPENAVALEGTPHVSIETVEDQVTRRQLTEAETAQNRLLITVDNGRYYWVSRGKLPLTLTSSGEFMYLSSPEVGKYVRFRRIDDTITYVEHVDMAHGTVTYWGELKIVLGR
jgi:hypothetical protein